MNLLNINQYSMSLLDDFYSAGMLPMVTRPTRVTLSSATLIDTIYVKTRWLDFLRNCHT